MMLTKILTRVTTVAASSAGATAVLESNQTTNEVQVPTQPTTIYSPHYEQNNDEFIFIHNPNNSNNDGTNSSSSSFLQNIANSNMMLDNNISPLNIGVTGSEFNCALTTLKENPDLIYDLMPTNFMNAEQTKKLCSAMQDVLSNPRVISTVKSKLLKYDPQSFSNMVGNDYHLNDFHQDHVKGNDDDNLTNSRSETSSSYAFHHNATNQLSPSEQWDQLASDHPCAICQDVLAKPTILSCSHSFCGNCLHDLITSCSEVHSTGGRMNNNNSTLHDIDEMISNMSVVKRCPTCNEEICRGGTYERTLDDAITVRASAIPICEGKNQWMERRLAHNVPAVSRRQKQKSSSTHDTDGGENGNDNDLFYWDWVIPALSVVMIALIAIFKSYK